MKRTPQEQITRNLKIATFNVIVAVVCTVIALVFQILRLAR